MPSLDDVVIATNSSSGKVRRDDPDAKIGEGTFRIVYEGTFTAGARAGEKSADKFFKSGAVFEDRFFTEDIKAFEEAARIIVQFNQYLKSSPPGGGAASSSGALSAEPPQIRINKPEVWHMTKNKERLLVEPYIDNFRKWNSNTGAQADGCDLVHALSHFSFSESRGQQVLCDLQGGCITAGRKYVLSDVVINSVGKKFGVTDLGPQGVENFMARHVCTSYCSPTWLQASNARFLLEAGMSTTFGDGLNLGGGLAGGSSSASGGSGANLGIANIRQRSPYRAPVVPRYRAPSPYRAPRYRAPSPVRSSVSWSWCNACGIRHKPGTSCPDDYRRASEDWSWCNACGIRHKPGTSCPDDYYRVSRDWSYCQRCDVRHKPETTCPKAGAGEKASWRWCYRCSRDHKPTTICPKSG